MSEDFYKVLGVDKKASKEEIKKAFRNQAKKHHPDKGGKAEQFKKVQEAYETLSDDQKKAQYDQFGSAGANFGEQGGGSYGQGFGGFSSANFNGQKVDLEDFGDIFSSFFGGGFGGNSRNMPRKGRDLEVEIVLSFEDSMKGIKQKFKSSYVKDGSIELEIPAGINHRDVMKFREKGSEGKNGGPRGDLYVHIQVKSHKKISRHGLDLLSELEVSLWQALLGGEFLVETFWEKVKLKIPELTKDGQLFRIKEKGVKKQGQIGDHIVKIIYKMPKKLDKKTREMLEVL